MERLWRPWRINYVRNVEELREQACIFCTKTEAGDDRSSLILYRGEKTYIMMNLFPYNTGHVMVSPYRHVSVLEQLDEVELRELMELTTLVVDAIKKELKPQGFNLGMNIGKISGAGFADHLHMHVVPRWQGDTNYMPVVAETKVMPESLEATYERLLSSIASILDE